MTAIDEPRATTADAAIERVRAMVLEGELRPGDRLPPEPEIRERLGISRNAYREAVKALEVVGVLNVRHGAGTFVADLDADDFVRSFALVVGLHDRSDAIHLLEVRRLLEAGAVASTRHDAATLADLRADVERMRATRDVQSALDSDVEFHRRLVAAHPNPYLVAMIDRLGAETFATRAARAADRGDALERMVSEHLGILDALDRGDLGLASALVSAHVSGVEAWARSTEDPRDP